MAPAATPVREPALLAITRLPDGPAVSAALRPAVPRLVDEMIDPIRAELPAYDRPPQPPPPPAAAGGGGGRRRPPPPAPPPPPPPPRRGALGGGACGAARLCR